MCVCGWCTVCGAHFKSILRYPPPVRNPAKLWSFAHFLSSWFARFSRRIDEYGYRFVSVRQNTQEKQYAFRPNGSTYRSFTRLGRNALLTAFILHTGPSQLHVLSPAVRLVISSSHLPKPSRRIFLLTTDKLWQFVARSGQFWVSTATPTSQPLLS